jgi:hypothetical protein
MGMSSASGLPKDRHPHDTPGLSRCEPDWFTGLSVR